MEKSKRKCGQSKLALNRILDTKEASAGKSGIDPLKSC
jgi:hypothetical protein